MSHKSGMLPVLGYPLSKDFRAKLCEGETP